MENESSSSPYENYRRGSETFSKTARFRFFFCGGGVRAVGGQRCETSGRRPVTEIWHNKKGWSLYDKKLGWPRGLFISYHVDSIRPALWWESARLEHERTDQGGKNIIIFFFFQFICLSDIHIHKLFKRERTKKGGGPFLSESSVAWQNAIVGVGRPDGGPSMKLPSDKLYASISPLFPSFFFRFQQLHPIMHHHHHPADGRRKKEILSLSLLDIYIPISGAIPKYRYPVQKRSAYNLFRFTSAIQCLRL